MITMRLAALYYQYGITMRLAALYYQDGIDDYNETGSTVLSGWH